MTVYLYRDNEPFISYPLPFDKDIQKFQELKIRNILISLNKEKIYNQIGMGEKEISISKRGLWYAEIEDGSFFELKNGEHELSVQIFDMDGNEIVNNKTILTIYDKQEDRKDEDGHEDVTPLDLLSSKNYTTKEIRNERFNICKACPRLFKPTRTCKECGCFMAAKTWLKEASCPIGKW
jgi:hypothetical protein